jgi:hypothetical protein
VLSQLEAGEREVDVGASLNLALSTIRTAIKNGYTIKAYAPTTLKLSATEVTRSRSCWCEEMGRRLSIWVDDQTRRTMPTHNNVKGKMHLCTYTGGKRRYARNFYSWQRLI